MNKMKILKVTWLLLCVGAYLLVYLGKDGAILMAYGMLILTFPMYFAGAVVGYLIAVTEIQMNVTLENFVVWLAMTVSGYWQWFILLPKIIAKIKAKREASRLSKSGN